MSSLERIVVVGASLAGVRATESLRTAGYTGAITMIGGEPHRPYDRPPLSKKILAGAWEPEQIELRKGDQLDQLGIELLLGTRATSLDTGMKRLTLADSGAVDYDGLILAVGARCRRLPNHTALDGLFELRTLDDSIALRDRLAHDDPRVVVIGAGFIGLEVAATARGKGLEVTVLEGAEAPMVRGLGAEMGRKAAEVHARHGVPIRCGVQVAGIEDDDGIVTGVRLADGEIVPADVVVVGIGVVPDIEWLQESGLTLGDGIECDATLSTGVPLVYAAGDCARWTNELFGETARIEHWTVAAEQGAHAAKNLLAEAAGEAPTPYAPVPFFWSDQYDRRIQFLGRAAPGDETAVVFDDIEQGKFLTLYGRDGRVVGALGMSVPRLVMPFRGFIEGKATWAEALAFAEELQA